MSHLALVNGLEDAAEIVEKAISATLVSTGYGGRVPGTKTDKTRRAMESCREAAGILQNPDDVERLQAAARGTSARP